MKRILTVFVALCFMCSCAGSLLENGYKTAKSAEITYNASRQILKDMDQRGQLTDEQKDKVIKVASDYYDGVMILKKALISYKKAELSQDEQQISTAESILQAAIDFVLSAETNLINILE